jgi:hypothetical protein
MLTAKNRMKKMKLKKNTVVLSALEVLEFPPYGNSANRVETAPVPVGEVRNRQRYPQIHQKTDVPMFTANHAGGKWLCDVRQLGQNGGG